MTAPTDSLSRWPLWKVCALGFLSMCASDVISTAMVIFESRYDAQLAGLSDVVGYLVSLVCSALALESIIKNGVRNRRSLAIIASVTVANYVGTLAGVYLTKGLM